MTHSASLGVQYWDSGPSPLRFVAFGFVPSGLCLRVCCPLVSLPMLVVMSRMGDIGFGVFGLMDPCLYSTELEQFYDVSFICIFPRYRLSVLVFLSHMMHSVCLVELVYLMGICYLSFGLISDNGIHCLSMSSMI